MTQNQQPRSMRWWIPASLIALATGAAFYFSLAEVPFLEPTLLAIAVLTVLLIGLWYIFLTGLPWKTRGLLLLVSVVFLIGIYLGLANLTRIEGSIGGSGIPRLVWKWSPKPDAGTAPLKLEPAPAPTDQSAEEIAAFDGEFPQFLGSNRLGVLTGIPLQRDWDHSPPKAVWRQPIGLGWSAFAISGQHAVTQEQRGEDELVVCYDVQVGHPMWAHTNQVRFSEVLGGDGPRATPTIHQDRVYAMGASGVLNCLEKGTGKAIWSRDVLNENQLSNVSWGKSCSPLLVRDLVVVTGGEERHSSLLAYEAATGNPVWKAGRDRASYCSPVLASLSGHEQIITVNGHSVTGHNPLNGEILWEYPWPDEFAKATQPLAIDTSRVLIAAGYGVGCVMLKVQPSGFEWSALPVWKSRSMKPKFTNLVRRGDHVYGLDDGILACMDLDQGKRMWKEGRYGHGQLLLVDELLIIQAESGEIVLVEISPEQPRELARFPALRGKTWNNPALVRDLLFVRNDHEAACYRLPLSSSP